MKGKPHREGGATAFGSVGFALLLGVNIWCSPACSDDTATEPEEKPADTSTDGSANASSDTPEDAGKDANSVGEADAAPPGPTIQLTALAQIGVVVEDADAASEAFTQTLGIGPWTTVEQTGKSVDGSAFEARLAYAYVGDLELELVEVTSGETPQTDFLREHGEGLYDLGFFVDDLDGDVARLKNRGATILLQEPGEWAYVDSPDAGGVIFKLSKTRDKLSIDATGFEPPADALRPTVIDHVGAWAADVNGLTAQWESTFGVGAWNVFPFMATPVMGDTLEATLGFTAALGPTQIELVQPTKGMLPPVLDRGHGRGLWEFAIVVTDPDAETAKLVDRGARLIVQVAGSTSVVDLGAGGVAVELIVPGA